MTDLAVLVADKDMEQTMLGLGGRCRSLGIREPKMRVFPHDRKDPGCYHYPSEVLQPHLGEYGLVLLDGRWEGRPDAPTEVLERRVCEKLLDVGWTEDRVGTVVIEPELEAWVWSDSQEVARVLGWDDMSRLGARLQEEGLWPDGEEKPPQPKEAMLCALRQAKIPHTPRIFRDLAERVSLRRCADPSFHRLHDLLIAWFG